MQSPRLQHGVIVPSAESPSRSVLRRRARAAAIIAAAARGSIARRGQHESLLLRDAFALSFARSNHTASSFAQLSSQRQQHDEEQHDHGDDSKGAAADTARGARRETEGSGCTTETNEPESRSQ